MSCNLAFSSLISGSTIFNSDFNYSFCQLSTLIIFNYDNISCIFSVFNFNCFIISFYSNFFYESEFSSRIEEENDWLIVSNEFSFSENGILGSLVYYFIFYYYFIYILFSLYCLYFYSKIFDTSSSFYYNFLAFNLFAFFN